MSPPYTQVDIIEREKEAEEKERARCPLTPPALARSSNTSNMATSTSVANGLHPPAGTRGGSSSGREEKEGKQQSPSASGSAEDPVESPGFWTRLNTAINQPVDFSGILSSLKQSQMPSPARKEDTSVRNVKEDENVGGITDLNTEIEMGSLMER